MANDAITMVGMRNAFYRDNYKRISLVLLISLVLNFSLGSLLYWMITHPPLPRYFATSVNGRITPLFPLNKPNQSDYSVLQWANQAAIAAFTFDFVNYKGELQAASEFFTPRGWSNFVKALEVSNNLDAVRTKKLNVSAVATKAPIVLDKGMLNGRYSWRVQMPVLVTYQSASQFTQETNLVTMLITRIPTLDAPRGIGISQFIVTPSSGATSG